MASYPLDLAGLLGDFTRNRPLTERDRNFQLKQKERLELVPDDQLSVIRMNSTYLELVDKWYESNGWLTLFFLPVAVMFSVLYVFLLHGTVTRTNGNGDDDLALMIFCTILIFPMIGFAAWTLRKEVFAYTHYPIRFNGKTRMVHVFRTNGTVLSVAWDDVFFTIAPLGNGFWNVLGHVLADDKNTVLKTFALSV